MTRFHRMTLAAAVLVAVGTMLAGLGVIPGTSGAVRTNLIGPESRIVTVESREGRPVPVTLELTALTQTRSLFAAETPYLEVAETRVRLLDAEAVAGRLDVGSLNRAVADYVHDRTGGRWLMDRVEVPRFAAGMAPTTVRTSVRHWLRSGLAASVGRLALLAFVTGGLVLGVLLLGERIWLLRGAVAAAPAS